MTKTYESISEQIRQSTLEQNKIVNLEKRSTSISKELSGQDMNSWGMKTEKESNLFSHSS